MLEGLLEEPGRSCWDSVLRAELMGAARALARADATCTYSVGRAGGKAVVTSLAFRFLCLMSPPSGEMSPFVLFLAPFSLCSAPLASGGGAGTFLGLGDCEGRVLPPASGSVVSVPISLLCAVFGIAFLFCGIILGCFLESV